MLLVVVLLVALLLGRLAGGSVEALGALPLRRKGLVAGALAVQVAGAVVGGPVHPMSLLLSAGLAGAFLVVNRGVRGTGLVALGLAANALVVALNGAMPVSAGAAQVAGVPPAALRDSRHEPLTRATRLPELGDVVPVLLPLRPEVVSAGDVLVAAGLAQLVVVGMLSGGRVSGGRVSGGPRALSPTARRAGRPLPALPPRSASVPPLEGPAPATPARSPRSAPPRSGPGRSRPRSPRRPTPDDRS